MSDPFVSIIIPTEEITDYIRESIEHINKQSYRNFEILIFSSKENSEEFENTRIVIDPSLAGKPAEKRDQALEYAKGEILAFIDDDAYPSQGWLAHAVVYFDDPKAAAVGGPGVTPPSDSLLQKASGWVSATWLGGGPEASYRFTPQRKREVDDYPSMNLLVRKSDFKAVGGFDSHYWPGEDTKLCLDFTKKLGKKIIYDPHVLVFHHRRPLFIPHLKQNGRYGLHRGHFARILPETSRRVGYFIPSLFTLGFFLGPFLVLVTRPFHISFAQLLYSLYLISINVYLFLLFLTTLSVAIRSRDIRLGLLMIPGIFLTHIWYGIQFVRGFLSPKLKK